MKTKKQFWLFVRDNGETFIAHLRVDKHDGPTAAEERRLLQEHGGWDRRYNLSLFTKSPEALRELADLIQQSTI